MGDTRREVAIDADLFRKLTNEGTNDELFMKILAELGYIPVMHEYVYDYELGGCALVRKLKAENKLKVYTDTDFITNENREIFENQFKDSYIYFNYKEFSEISYGESVYDYRHQGESLGEIRTALMAFYLGIDVIFSDDGKAKKYIENNISSRRHRISVYNIYDTLILLHENNCDIRWKEVKGMAKVVFDKAPDKFDRINQIWHENV